MEELPFYSSPGLKQWGVAHNKQTDYCHCTRPGEARPSVLSSSEERENPSSCIEVVILCPEPVIFQTLSEILSQRPRGPRGGFWISGRSAEAQRTTRPRGRCGAQGIHGAGEPLGERFSLDSPNQGKPVSPGRRPRHHTARSRCRTSYHPDQARFDARKYSARASPHKLLTRPSRLP